MESTITAMKRFSTAKLVRMMKPTKKIHANGCSAITGRATPMDQLSSVIT